jgi:hypothetical protein
LCYIPEKAIGGQHVCFSGLSVITRTFKLFSLRKKSEGHKAGVETSENAKAKRQEHLQPERHEQLIRGEETYSCACSRVPQLEDFLGEKMVEGDGVQAMRLGGEKAARWVEGRRGCPEARQVAAEHTTFYAWNSVVVP